MCSTMVVAVGGWRLAAVGGWQLATGGWWRLVVVGGGWWLAVGGWRQLAVGNWRLVAAGGWRRLVAGGWWRLVVGGWWRLAVDGSWRLAVGGPLGLSLRAVLSKKKKKISFLKDAPEDKHPSLKFLKWHHHFGVQTGRLLPVTQHKNPSGVWNTRTARQHAGAVQENDTPHPTNKCGR